MRLFHPTGIGRYDDRVRYCVIAVLAGCSFKSGNPQTHDDGSVVVVDAPIIAIDAPDIDAPPACTLWHPHHFAPCNIGAPSGPMDLGNASGYVYNTTSGTLVDSAGTPITHANIQIDQNGQAAWLMNVQSFTLHAGSTLRVIGNKPLIIASWDTIDVSGTIDATSSSGTNLAGAGSNPTALCTAPAAGGDSVATSGGSGGGGGGAFGGDGGAGGIGDSPPGPIGGNGGTHVAAPHIVRGGCNGAVSGKAGPGDAGNPNAVSNAGVGGGGIQLTAQHALTVSGKVLAGGSGGGGAPNGSAAGGGGGGSGGYIGLEGVAVTLAGVIAANGGGGGASAAFVDTGTPGQDAQPSATAANGAPHQCTGTSDGGAGGTTGNGATVTGNNNCGGGGGGGSTGFVLTFGATNAPGTVSPPALHDVFVSPN